MFPTKTWLKTWTDFRRGQTWIFRARKKPHIHGKPNKKLVDEANILEHRDIAITTAEGHRHVCKGYRVEERAPGEFIIWCEAPFRITVVEK